MKRLISGFGLLALFALAPQPASADLFEGDGPLCSVFSIGCAPPPPPPPPVAEPVAAPAKPVRQARKARVKKPKPAAEAPAEAAPAAK